MVAKSNVKDFERLEKETTAANRTSFIRTFTPQHLKNMITIGITKPKWSVIVEDMVRYAIQKEPYNPHTMEIGSRLDLWAIKTENLPLLKYLDRFGGMNIQQYDDKLELRLIFAFGYASTKLPIIRYVVELQPEENKYFMVDYRTVEKVIRYGSPDVIRYLLPYWETKPSAWDIRNVLVTLAESKQPYTVKELVVKFMMRRFKNLFFEGYNGGKSLLHFNGRSIIGKNVIDKIIAHKRNAKNDIQNKALHFLYKPGGPMARKALHRLAHPSQYPNKTVKVARKSKTPSPKSTTPSRKSSSLLQNMSPITQLPNRVLELERLRTVFHSPVKGYAEMKASLSKKRTRRDNQDIRQTKRPRVSSVRTRLSRGSSVRTRG